MKEFETIKPQYAVLDCYKNERAVILCRPGDSIAKTLKAKGYTIQIVYDCTPSESLWKHLDGDGLRLQEIHVILSFYPLFYSRKIAIELAEFCKTYGIVLLDYAGHDLIAMQQSEVQYEDSYGRRSLSELKREIDKSDVISFDIFDTLLCRNAAQPDTVYKIVAQKCNLDEVLFLHRRKIAEESLTNATLDEVYSELARLYDWSHENAAKVRQCEHATECAVLVPRTQMRQALLYAVKSGKKVHLISDMYLDENALTEILKKNRIKGYQKLWVSCARKKTKYAGLFEEFTNAVKGKSYLHIGDNRSVDGVCAEAAGMNTYLIKSPAEMAMACGFAPILSACNTVNDEILAGMIISKLFNNPFAFYGHNGKTRLSVRNAGGLLLGPVASGLILWMSACLQKQPVQGILFPARDGYLFQRLYDYYRQYTNMEILPRSIYLEISRSVCILGDVRGQADVEEFVESCPYSGTQALLHKRFMLTQAQCNNISAKNPAYDDSDCNNDLSDYLDEIKARSSELRSGIEKYLRTLGIKPNEVYAFFDLISSGTTQLHLQSIMGSALNGLYLIKKGSASAAKEQMAAYSYAEGGAGPITEWHFLLESVFSSAKPSAHYIDEKSTVHYEDEKRAPQDIRLMNEMQQGIEMFFRQFLDIAVPNVLISKKLAEAALTQLANPHIIIENKQLYDMRIYDDWSQVELKCFR